MGTPQAVVNTIAQRPEGTRALRTTTRVNHYVVTELLTMKMMRNAMMGTILMETVATVGA